MKCNNIRNARNAEALRSLLITLCIAVIVLIAGCTPQRYIEKHRADVCRMYCQVSDSSGSFIQIDERDTLLDPFEAAFIAMLECDSTNNMILTELSNVTADNGKLNAKIQDNKLTIQFLTDSLKGKVFTRYEKIYIKVDKINPLNIDLENQCKKLLNDNAKLIAEKNDLTAKIKAKNKIIGYLSGLSGLSILGLSLWIFLKLKK
jgi:hypothetical protein